ncbi:MAG: DUF2807 domain-containing protein [Flavobacteriales bacterium]|nr:DUF2807 domain-containing protein [Flavobacteriales bacterium]
MNRLFLPAAAACCLLVIGCLPGVQVRGTGETVHRVLVLPDFHGIVLEGAMDVELTPSDARSVEVEAQGEIVDLVTTEVKDGIWRIGTKRSYSTDQPFVVRIAAPLIDQVSVEGSGDVEGKGSFKMGRAQLSIEGSGSIALELDAGELHAEVDGSGGMRLSGACGSFMAAIDGSGGIDAHALRVGDARLEIGGSGSMQVDATGEVDAVIEGSGDVRLMREPAALKQKVSGSGEVRVAR